MQDLTARLAQLAELAASIAKAVIGGCALRGIDETTVVEVLATAARIERCLDAVQIEAVGEVVQRSDSPATEGRMTHRFGCRTVGELVQRATLCAPASASRLITASRAVHRTQSATTGEILEAELPALRDALRDGVVGVDGALAIAAPLGAMSGHVSREAVLTADEVLAAAARGEGRMPLPRRVPICCACKLRRGRSPSIKTAPNRTRVVRCIGAE